MQLLTGFAVGGPERQIQRLDGLPGGPVQAGDSAAALRGHGHPGRGRQRPRPDQPRRPQVSIGGGIFLGSRKFSENSQVVFFYLMTNYDYYGSIDFLEIKQKVPTLFMDGCLKKNNEQ